VRGGKDLGHIASQHFRSHKVEIPWEEKVSHCFAPVSDCSKHYKRNRKDTENDETLGVNKLHVQTECTSSS